MSVPAVSPYLISRNKEISRRFNVRDDLQELTTDQVAEVCRLKAYDFSVAIDNLNGGMNVGMILRTSILNCAENFYIFGIKKWDRRTAIGAQNYLVPEHVPDVILHDPFDLENPQSSPEAFLDFIERENVVPIFVEQGGKFMHKVDFKEVHDNVKKSDKKVCLIFGNESHGIDPDILALSEFIENSMIVSIYQPGILRSHNVACAAAIMITTFCNAVYLD